MFRIPTLLILICVATFPVRAEVEAHGYYKSFALVFSLPPELSLTKSNPPLGLVSNRLRLKINTKISDRIRLEGAWDLSAQFSGDTALTHLQTVPGITEGDYRIIDPETRLIPSAQEPEAGFSLSHNLDRLFVTVKLKGADLFVGRQAISWGSGRVINPTDVIAPFAFNELDTEDRRGVDAVRLRIPLGMMDELDMGWVAGRNFHADLSAFFLRARVSLLRTDTSLVLMAFRRHLLVGLDLARSIGGAGAWLEAAWVRPHSFAPELSGSGKPYVRLSTGMDYSFSGGVYTFCEYHFNSAGSGTPGGYSGLWNTSAYREGAVYLMGRHYVSLGTTIQVTPLLPVTLLGIWNLSDGSITLSPAVEYNVAENLYLAAGAYFTSGASPESTAPGLRYGSEFGAWPHMFYTSFRYYF